MSEKNYMGLDGMYWFVGVVENRQDPLFIGRVKCRAIALHSASLTDIPSNDLPWAQVAQSTNDDKPPILKEGDVVMGFFADGRSAQIPIIMFKLPGLQSEQHQGQGFSDQRSSATLQNAPRKPATRTYNKDGSGIVVTSPSTATVYPLSESIDKPTLSGVTRYDIANTVIQARKNNLDKGVPVATGLTWDEPYPAYNPLYPYNKATETESGHVIEYDDTPGSERISLTHRTGSFQEWYPSGSKVEKITKSNYSIVMGDDYCHVMGRVLLTVGEGVYIKVLGDVNIEADNNVNLQVAGDMDVSVGGAFNVKAKSANFDIAGDSTVLTGGKQFFTAGDDLHLNSERSAFVTAVSQLELFSSGTIDMKGSEINADISAEQADTGSAAGLPPAPSKATPNAGKAGPEPIPVPFVQNFDALDAYTGTAFKQGLLLNTDGTPPDSNNMPNTTCNFDANTKTFLSSDQWTISQNGLLQIQQREGLAKVLANGMVQAYPDPVIGASLLTIGYGITSAVLSTPLTTTTVQTKEQCAAQLNDVINSIFLPKLKEYIDVDLTQNMVDALISIMYNIGTGNFSSSTLRKDVNAQQWCNAGQDFMSWRKSGGQIVAGLVNRRKSESTQFLS